MTVKEHLHQLVESLTDEQAKQAERALELLAVDQRGRGRHRESAFVGQFASGHTDTSHRVDEILADGFGR
jgi:hypothetical protein